MPAGLRDLLARQCGVLTAAQAGEQLTAAAVRWQLASGRWQRVCRGVLVAYSWPVAPDARLWVAVLAAGPGALLGGLTAAALDGLRGYEPAVPHIVVPPGREVTRLRGLVVHRSAVTPPADVHPTGRPPRTRIAPPAHAIRADPTTVARQMRSALQAAGWRSVGVSVGVATETPTDPGG